MRVVISLLLFAISALGLTSTYAFFPGIGKVPRLERKVDSLSIAAARWKGHALGWEANFKESERLREAEKTAAREAVQSLDLQCDARVSAARRSTLAIQSIVNKEPKRDQAGCPMRELVPVGELRDALTPDAG